MSTVDQIEGVIGQLDEFFGDEGGKTMGTMMRTPLLLQTLFDRAAQVQPASEIVTKLAEGYHRITYKEHQARTHRLASAFSKWGLKESERVATCMWNNSRHLQLYHAIPCMGAILHPLNVRLHPKEQGYIIGHAKDRVLMVDATLLKVIEALTDEDLKNVDLIIVCGVNEKPGNWKTVLSDRKTVIDFDEFLATGEEGFRWPSESMDENQGACLVYTSGTTGNPKGIIYSHRSTYLHTMAIMATDVMGLSGTDCILPIVPMFHAMSWGIPFVCLTLGCKLCQISRFLTPDKILEMVQDEKVTYSAGVPAIWQMVRGMLTKEPEKYESIRGVFERLGCGGSAPPAELMEWFYNEWGCKFIQGWGMTETNPIASMGGFAMTRKHLGQSTEQKLKNITKAGILLPSLEATIVNPEDFNQVQPQDGEAIGELLIRGPWITGSYYANPEATKEKFWTDKDGHRWLCTGDIAKIDPDKYIIIADRSKDLVKSGGEWISSVDMENTVVAMPEVNMACVVGVPHPKWDERPIVIAVCGENKPPTLEAVRKHLSSKFAKFQLPDDVLVWEKLPFTGTKKMDKKTVRKMLKEQEYVLPDLRK